jgi:hypothetical protein
MTANGCLSSCRGIPWEVLKSADYRIYQTPHPPRPIPRVTLLLQVDASGHAGEGFRFAVEGGPFDADIWSRDLLDPPALSRYKLRYELKGQDINLRPTSLASKWEDLHVLLGRGVIIAQRLASDEDVTLAFREALAAEKTADPAFGVALRWTIQGTNRGELRLVLQGLPSGARRLRSEPLLSADEAAAIHLEEVEVVANIKEEGACRGPIPVLFARDPEASEAALALHPEKNAAR